jgi:serine/threonine-protein kinase
MPTVDELTTLLGETPHGADFCIDPVFDPTQLRLWSCDRCSFISAWYVDAQLGFVHHLDFDAPFYARAVCG